MKKGTKKFLFLSVATLAGMYAYNQFVASTSTKKPQAIDLIANGKVTVTDKKVHISK